MHVGSIQHEGRTVEVVVDGDRALPLADFLPSPRSVDMFGELDATGLAAAATAHDGDWLPVAPEDLGIPYLGARKVIGIGLNYPEHTDDLEAPRPEEPTFFLKADHTLIGNADEIPVPVQSERTTAEAELGLVIGRPCYQVDEDAALDHVWGAVPVLDQTAEDILQRNPRFLVRSKNFPGFFSFGPTVTPLADVLATHGDLASVPVSTVHNGEVHRRNHLANAYFSPAFIVSFLSHVMPLFPGDIISTGTPGAVVIEPGDVVACEIDGVGRLENPVGGRGR